MFSRKTLAKSCAFEALHVHINIPENPKKSRKNVFQKRSQGTEEYSPQNIESRPGRDIQHENRISYLEIKGTGIYNPISGKNLENHALELSSPSNRFSIYAFTFGSCEIEQDSSLLRQTTLNSKKLETDIF